MRSTRHARALASALVLLGAGACGHAGPTTPAGSIARTDRINPDPLDGSVRFVWFVPSDVAYDSATVDAIDRAAYNVRSWYRALLGGTTFRIDSLFPVEVVFGDHTRAWYEQKANPWGWDPLWNANYWIDTEVKQKLDVTDWSPHYKVAIYMSAEGGGGSSVGRLTIPQHDVDGIQKGELNVNRFWGGLAHELGHTFDLPDASGDDGSIMSGALYAYPAATLLDVQKQTLLESARNTDFFVDPGPAFDPQAYYLMLDVGTGQAAALETPDTTSDIPVVQADSSGAAAQQWRLEARPDGTCLIRNRASGKLLVVGSRANAGGAPIVQSGDGDPAYQSWYVLSVGVGRYEVIAAYDVVANQRTEGLAAPDGATAGTQLVQEDFVTAERQIWRFTQVR